MLSPPPVRGSARRLLRCPLPAAGRRPGGAVPGPRAPEARKVTTVAATTITVSPSRAAKVAPGGEHAVHAGASEGGGGAREPARARGAERAGERRGATGRGGLVPSGEPEGPGIGGAAKDRRLKDRSWVEATRGRWERLVNAHLEGAGASGADHGGEPRGVDRASGGGGGPCDGGALAATPARAAPGAGGGGDRAGPSGARGPSDGAGGAGACDGGGDGAVAGGTGGGGPSAAASAGGVGATAGGGRPFPAAGDARRCPQRACRRRGRPSGPCAVRGRQRARRGRSAVRRQRRASRVVRRQLWPLVLPHIGMLPGCLKTIVPMVLGWERQAARRRGHVEPLSATKWRAPARSCRQGRQPRGAGAERSDAP